MQVIDTNQGLGNFASQFNQGLQGLINLKMEKMQRTHESRDIGKAFQALGIPADKAQAFSQLPVRMQQEFIAQGLLSSLQSPSGQPQQASGGSGLEQTLAPQQQPQQQQAPTGLRQAFNPSLNPQDMLKQALSGGMSPQQQQQLAGPQQQQIAPQNQQVVAPQQKGSQIAATKPEVSPLLTTKQRAEQAKSLREETKADKVEQHYINKELAPYIKDLDNKGGINAKFTDVTLNKLEKLIDTGKLTSSSMYNFRKKMEEHGGAIGGAIGGALGTLGGAVLGTSTFPGVGTVGGALSGASIGANAGKGVGELIGQKFVGSKEDQEFTKLTLGSFLPKMKDIFGSRVAIQEMQIFMDSIPSLSQTDEGKRAIIKNMRLANDAWKYIKQTKDRIVAENDGRIPSDLEARVDKITNPYLERLAQQFSGNIPQELLTSS